MSEQDKRSVEGMDTGQAATGQNAQHTGGVGGTVPRIGEPMQPHPTREKKIYIHYIKPLTEKTKSKVQNVANSTIKCQHITDWRELPYWSADASMNYNNLLVFNLLTMRYRVHKSVGVGKLMAIVSCPMTASQSMSQTPGTKESFPGILLHIVYQNSSTMDL